MAFATDDNILKLIPTIFDFGIESFTDELTQAQADVTRKIQIEWYNKTHSPSNFDSTLLTETQWQYATMYRALSNYIFPMLSKWTPEGDSHREQIEFYAKRFAEEIKDQFAVGIEYDQDEDDIISAGEITRFGEERLWR